MADGRVALVTGGARGIGRATAARLARDGWRVVVADRDEASFMDFPARFVRADVSDEAAVAGLINGIRQQEGRLDGLVCNAGFRSASPFANWASPSGRRCSAPT